MEQVLKETLSHGGRGVIIVTGYHEIRAEFIASIMKDDVVTFIGFFSQGLTKQEFESLLKTIESNQSHRDGESISVAPGICVELSFKGMKNGELTDTSFLSFTLDTDYQTCTIEKLILDNLPHREDVSITHPSKQYWSHVTKSDYISYLMHVSPFLLPMLKEKQLTVIRYPDGVDGESFYQKNCPDYAPDFIQTSRHDDIDYIVCNDLSTLVWLGNQGTIEFHIPFHTRRSTKPVEIVFDLDPPDEESFHLVILAAKEIHAILSSLKIVSFPKLTGSKGIQIHIPIKGLTYEETRVFTSFVADYLVEEHPSSFTVERLKRNRHGRLYVDFLQHAEGKTMICPYSTRGKQNPTVAAPLFWEEITDSLSPTSFTIETVLERIQEKPCPFDKYYGEKNEPLNVIIDKLRER